MLGAVGSTGFGLTGAGLKRDGIAVVVAVVVVVPLALWKSSKSSSAASPPLISTALPFPLDALIVTGASTSKLNKSACLTGAAVSFFVDGLRGIELLVTGERAPPSSNSSYSSN